jgi:hypothetical protein
MVQMQGAALSAVPLVQQHHLCVCALQHAHIAADILLLLLLLVFVPPLLLPQA